MRCPNCWGDFKTGNKTCDECRTDEVSKFTARKRKKINAWLVKMDHYHGPRIRIVMSPDHSGMTLATGDGI